MIGTRRRRLAALALALALGCSDSPVGNATDGDGAAADAVGGIQAYRGVTTAPYLLLPGQSLVLRGLPAGVHRFQCCIHPWMRQVIRVEAGAS